MNLLAFFAHPDDETILAGGTLAILARQDVQVHYLCATRGEGGEVGEPPVCQPEELGEVREQELVCAVQALGGRSLTFLGYSDPRIGPDEQLYPFTDDPVTLAGQIALSIRQHQPAVVITHGSNGEYGHPAHVLAYQAALSAVLSHGQQAPCLYTVAAIFPEHPNPRLANQDDPAHLVVAVTDALDRKERAARCHRTQNALFVRRASEEAGRQLDVAEVLMAVEGLRRAHPPLEGRADDPLAAVLRQAGVLI